MKVKVSSGMNGDCTRCNTFINTYIPQAHQCAVHTDTHRFVGNFGAYGQVQGKP